MYQSGISFGRVAGALSTLALLAPAALWAQAAATGASAAAADSTTLEEVVVTAEKRPENLQKTSISIQVTSGAELRAEGKRRIDDILDGTVGVQAQGSEVGTSFFMRGVGRNTGQLAPPGSNGPTQSAVAVLIDGVYQSRGEAVRGGTLDLAQTEVMRGPQSTTLGGSSLAGAVSLVSNQPIFDYQVTGSLETGNYNLLATEGVLNLPLSSTTALRIAGSTNKHDGYDANGADDSDLSNARAKFRWQPSQDLDLVLTASRQLIGGQGVTTGALSYEGYWVPWAQCSQAGVGGTDNCSDTTSNAGTMSRGYRPTYGHVDSSVTYQDRSNPWDDGMPPGQWGHTAGQTTTIAAYSADINWNLGFGMLTLVPSYDSGNLVTAEYGGPTFYSQEHNHFNTTQLDAHLSSPSGSTLSWIAGVNYYNYKSAGDQAFVLYPGANSFGTNCAATSLVDCYVWVQYPEDNQETKSAYGNLKYPILDTLRVVAGLRYSSDTKSTIVENGSTNGDNSGPSTPSVFYPEASASWNAVTYRAGLEYDLRPESMAYATYSTGYQPGNVIVGMGAFPATSCTGIITCTPKETLDQITLGLKNRFLDGRLQLNVEAFDSTYHHRGNSNAISATRTNSLGTAPTTCQAPPGPPAAVTVYSDFTCIIIGGNTLTIPTLTSRGADVELNWLVTQNDGVDLSLEYLSAVQTTPVSSATYNAATVATSGGTSVIADPTASGDAAALLAAVNSAFAAYNGATLSNSPKWSGNFTYRHNFRFAGSGTLTPEFNMSYKSSYWTAGNGLGSYTPQNPGPAQQDAYSLYNADLRWTSGDGKFTLTGYIKNIQNTPVLTNWNAVGGFRGPAWVSLDNPRTFGVIANVTL